jgi:hypothetical protein
VVCGGGACGQSKACDSLKERINPVHFALNGITDTLSS